MAKNNFFDVLVVREIDRLSRSLAKQLIIEEELKRNGIRIEYVLGDYSDTPEGILNKNIKAVIAEYERLKISERMIRGRRLKVRSGSVISHGNAPFGYKIDSSDGAEILVIDESAARVIRMIFDLYTSGENDSSPLSINGITRKLTTLNIPTPSDVNKYPGKKKKAWGQWSSATVNKIIRNKTYVGEWLYGKSGHYPKNGRWERKPDDNLLAVEVPPIIQEDVWHIAQERLAKNREKSKRNLKYDYLLSKRVTCGLCGHKISGIGKRSRGRLYQYYRCLGSMKSLQMASDCTAPHFRSNVVDRLVWSWVKDLLINPDRLEDGYKAFVRKSEIENEPIKERMNLIEDLIAENQQQLDRLIDLYLSDEFPQSMLIERKNQLENTIQSLKSEWENLDKTITESAGQEEQLKNLKEFITEVTEGISIVENDFSTKRKFMELLDLQVTEP